jgi:hypothetical protein
MHKARLIAAGGVAVVGLYLLARKPAPVGGQAGGSASTSLLTPPKVAQPTTTTTPKPAPVAAVPTNSTRATLIARVEAAIKKEVPARPNTETAASIHALAVYLVEVCAAENYPLDLAFGHAYAESSLALYARNPSSGASGPLQVTPIAVQDIGAAWPPSPENSVRGGVRYMKLLRSRHAECRASVKVTLQHYGMGRGNWLKFHAGGCGPSPCTNNLSVWQAECGCGRAYSALIIAVAKRHPELKTVGWWGS